MGCAVPTPLMVHLLAIALIGLNPSVVEEVQQVNHQVCHLPKSISFSSLDYLDPPFNFERLITHASYKHQ